MTHITKLQVIGVGPGRTGTQSLKLALEQLGFGPCYDMHMASSSSSFSSSSSLSRWLVAYDRVYVPQQRFRALHSNDPPRSIVAPFETQARTPELRRPPISSSSSDNRRSNDNHHHDDVQDVDLATAREVFDSLLAGSVSAVDMPCTVFYPTLRRLHPNAKFVLTVRDSGEVWYKSVRNTIYRMAYNESYFEAISDVAFPQACAFVRTLNEYEWCDWMANTMNSPCAAARRYEEKNKLVEAEFSDAPGQLLVFNVKQGWAPLCKFLNVPIPNTPFPHVNDTEDFENRIRYRKLIQPLLILASTVIALASITAICVVLWKSNKITDSGSTLHRK